MMVLILIFLSGSSGFPFGLVFLEEVNGFLSLWAFGKAAACLAWLLFGKGASRLVSTGPRPRVSAAAVKTGPGCGQGKAGLFCRFLS